MALAAESGEVPGRPTLLPGVHATPPMRRRCRHRAAIANRADVDSRQAKRIPTNEDLPLPATALLRPSLSVRVSPTILRLLALAQTRSYPRSLPTARRRPSRRCSPPEAYRRHSLANLATFQGRQ